MKNEQRGIYNVTFNEKKATPIKTDIEAIENAIIDYVIHYVKGWHNIKRDKGRVATDKIKGEGLIPPLSPSDEIIITFYSDRNLNTRMVFKNPQVDSYYTQTPQSTEDSILQRALELQTKQQRGELENFFTHQEENTNESKSKKGEKQS
ncbi:hypothetical protein CCZ01_09165 [Helicobacter monodelphidis]|uniref:hypothetical protein n=1 Tax=Helicobacter sp. 15-1451 TaxID=2004995 RepID=UPI000DCE03CC|nr:hypothetical protein [Helicobacter sp. 15-1451]RAX56566.1 hypothetical protein CCZ01_09165 [Helicobacter sp. 15-1451]